MKINLNNNELVAILKAIEISLEYFDDNMMEASLMSFVRKVNNNVRTFNRKPEELAIDLIAMLRDIKAIKEE